MTTVYPFGVWCVSAVEAGTTVVVFGAWWEPVEEEAATATNKKPWFRLLVAGGIAT